MNKVVDFLEKRSVLFWTTAGILSVIFLGSVDYLTGYEVSISFFYLAPIAAVAWYVNGRLGLAISGFSALTWMVTNIAAGERYSQPIIFLWNILIGFGVFAIVTYLVVQWRRNQEGERAHARLDFISGAVNARCFHEILNRQIKISDRATSPFTIAYLDMDNFKPINDTWGHETGNDVIRFVANSLKSQLRSTDTIARLGGDEFALLLPGAGQAEAQIVVSRLHTNLTQQMQKQNWPVTFSIGVVSCTRGCRSAKELIKMADELMYSVKNSTKNDIRFAMYSTRSGVMERGNIA